MVTHAQLTNNLRGVRILRTPLYPTKIVFYTIFSLAFLLSGIITISGIIPYRMGLASLLVVPILLRRGIRINQVAITYLLLVASIVVSALINGTSVYNTVLFLRTVVFSYLSYYITEKYVDDRNIQFILRLCLAIALVQLPVVTFQLLAYNILPDRIKGDIGPRDYDFGTFNYKGDSSMSFFIIIVLVFLLFDLRHRYVTRHRVPVLLWLTTTVFLANSELSKLTLMVIWAIYLATRLNRRSILILICALLVLGTIVAHSGAGEALVAKLGRSIDNTMRGLEGDPRLVDRFLRGDYSRGGAIYYYIDRGISWFGDGPSAYYDPITRARVYANTGHAFTFYGETGLIGLILSYVALGLIAFPFRNGRLLVRPACVMGFMAILVLSFSAEVLNDISFVLIYCIMAKAYLIGSRSGAPRARNVPDSRAGASLGTMDTKSASSAAVG